VYGSIAAKKAAVETVLRRLETEGRLSTLVGWAYIREAFQALPKLLRYHLTHIVLLYACSTMKNSTSHINIDNTHITLIYSPTILIPGFV